MRDRKCDRGVAAAVRHEFGLESAMDRYARVTVTLGANAYQSYKELARATFTNIL